MRLLVLWLILKRRLDLLPLFQHLSAIYTFSVFQVTFELIQHEHLFQLHPLEVL